MKKNQCPLNESDPVADVELYVNVPTVWKNILEIFPQKIDITGKAWQLISFSAKTGLRKVHPYRLFARRIALIHSINDVQVSLTAFGNNHC